MLDAKLILHNGAVSTALTTTYSDYEIDFEVADPNFGKGRSIDIVGVATASLAGDADASVVIRISNGAAASPTSTYLSPNGATEYDNTAYSFTCGTASVISPGTELFRWRLPDSHERYMRAAFTVDAAGATIDGVAIYLQPRW